jgi:hypothetical protein
MFWSARPFLLPLIHRSAWKVNSRKYTLSIAPVLCGMHPPTGGRIFLIGSGEGTKPRAYSCRSIWNF